MQTLTPRQRALLKALAHHLGPTLHIGKDGVTDTVLRNLAEAFRTRELLKARVLETAPASTQETAAAIHGAAPDIHVVQVIGRTIVLFRRHPEKPEIRLPS